MTRKQRITYLEIKLQNPDLTLSSRIRDTEILKDLKYIDELEHRYKSLQGAYVRLKERGLEAGRKHCWRDGTTVIEYCDLCDNCLQPGDTGWNEGEVLHRALTDTLIRHKWPEEKPKLTDWYLVECVSSSKWHEVVYWKDGCFFIDQRCLRKAFNEAITHWWNLPEVRK